MSPTPAPVSISDQIRKDLATKLAARAAKDSKSKKVKVVKDDEDARDQHFRERMERKLATRSKAIQAKLASLEEEEINKLKISHQK